MQYGSLSIGLALAACLGVSGCGEKRTLGEEPVPVQRSECGGIFVLAPASYMQYIQHDEATLLASEGRYEDLPVFCTEEMARMLEERLEHDHELLPGLWRVYRRGCRGSAARRMAYAPPGPAYRAFGILRFDDIPLRSGSMKPTFLRF